MKGDTYKTTGVAVLTEPDARFQNAFGAMVNNTRVRCEYDLREKKVLDVPIVNS